jgi:hypothetical protein
MGQQPGRQWEQGISLLGSGGEGKEGNRRILPLHRRWYQ